MRSSVREFLLTAAALACLTLFVYAPVRTFEFLNYDDQLYVTETPQVVAGLTWEGLAWAFTASPVGNWHPLTLLSHMLDASIYGLAPGGHHLTSLWIHTANAILLFTALSFMTGAPRRSAYVAALFAVHPLNVQSVAWISERKNVLSTLFWLLAMLAYTGYIRHPEWKRYTGLLLILALGLMAKPMLVTLPLTLLLLDYWPLGRITGPGSPDPRLGLLVEKAPLFILVGTCGFIAIRAQGVIGAVMSMEVFSIPTRVANALVSYVVYAGKMFWPSHLSVFYPHPGSLLPSWQVVASTGALLAISTAALLLFRRLPWLAVGWLWYLVTLLPVVGLVQVGGQARADRYAYLPLIGLFVIVVWGATELGKALPRGNAVLTVAGFGVLLALSLTARHELYPWRNSIALFEHALRSTSRNFLAHNNLAYALVEKGRYDEAVDHFSRGCEIAPFYATAHINLASALALRGDLEAAIAQYEEARRLDPGDNEIVYHLARTLFNAGRLADAAEAFQQVIRTDPQHALAHADLGWVLYYAGKHDEAAAILARALELRPDLAPAHWNLGFVLRAQGRPADAAAHLRRAVELDPARYKGRSEPTELFEQLEKAGRQELPSEPHP